MTEQAKEKAVARKINILQEVTVEADLSGMLWRNQYYYYKNPEEHAKDLEQAVKDFDQFLRDHRSQDMVRLNVNKKYQDICSICKERWEPDEDENGKYCACCGARIEENIG
jgi:hypothetical protein